MGKASRREGFIKMMDFILIVLSFFISNEQAARFSRTDPTDLSAEIAKNHIAAAAFAGTAYNVDGSLLLAVAWHESRYTDAVTPESGGRSSCGPMTPTPIARCSHSGVLVGYLRGADHLAGWLRAEHGSLRLALLGYAGGYSLLRACAAGPVVVARRGGDLDLCRTPEVFLARASWIRREMRRPET